MKAGNVLRLLQISRPTLYRYRKNGIITAKKLPNGQYNYNSEDVYKFLNKGIPRKTYLYARVSTVKQKQALARQTDQLKQWALINGYMVHGVYTDVASGLLFEKRQDFFKMLDTVLDHQVERVIITHKDRLSRVGFGLLKHLFEHYGRVLSLSQNEGILN